MKRNENIQAFSREHHSGLLFCWKIKAGLKKGIDRERILSYVYSFWFSHLMQHFQEEEELLLLNAEDTLCKKGLLQHEEIRSLLSDLIRFPDKLGQLSEYVEDHIRFEERELFPHLEAMLTEEELKDIGMVLNQSHVIPFSDNYHDEFWKN